MSPNLRTPLTPFLSIFITGFLACIILVMTVGHSPAQQDATTGEITVPSGGDSKINVLPAAEDEAIEDRLTKILEATGWFFDISVEVEEGVVFMNGRTDTEDYRKWAGELARKISDVAAVVNHIQVIEPSFWDMTPVFNEMNEMWKASLKRLPRLMFGIAALLIFLLFIRIIIRYFSSLLDRRLKPLLRDVTSRITTVLAVLIGIYFALQIAGLSSLATTILGGTGIAGLVAGIAFRDILENYLASILISLRNPFRIGDVVEINEHTGIVEKVTTRGTVLMNLDGNHVQIPNSIVYKSIIRNYTANPNCRGTFEVGIGFDNEISFAQKTVFTILSEHPAVLDTPEALVLVNSLGSATVKLKVYFWYDLSVHNGFKLTSSLLRLVKSSFEKENISMPDEAREVLFPQGVSVRMEEQPQPPDRLQKKEIIGPQDSEELSTSAEGHLASEDVQLRGQARASRTPEEGENLLEE